MLTYRPRIREHWFRITIICMVTFNRSALLEQSHTPLNCSIFSSCRRLLCVTSQKMIFWLTTYFSVVRQQTVEGEQEDARHGHQLRGPLHRRASVLYDGLHGPQIWQHLKFGIKVSLIPFKSGNRQFLKFQLVFLHNFKNRGLFCSNQDSFFHLWGKPTYWKCCSYEYFFQLC